MIFAIWDHRISMNIIDQPWFYGGLHLPFLDAFTPKGPKASRHPFEAKNQAALLIKILRGQLLGVKSTGSVKGNNWEKQTNQPWHDAYVSNKRGVHHKQSMLNVTNEKSGIIIKLLGIQNGAPLLGSRWWALNLECKWWFEVQVPNLKELSWLYTHSNGQIELQENLCRDNVYLSDRWGWSVGSMFVWSVCWGCEVHNLKLLKIDAFPDGLQPQE